MDCESDEDMFADLEQTLCEGLTTLRFDRFADVSDVSEIDVSCLEDATDLSKINGDSEIDVSCLEDATDLSKINGPAVRSYNLYKTTKAFQNKQYLDSIFFETFAMSLFMRIKFHANKIMEGELHMPTEDNLAILLEQKHEERPEIIDYLDRFLNDRLLPSVQRLKSIEFKNGTELMKLCRQLPNEWTVIQLCKGVNTEIFRQSREETLRYPCVIFLTLFCYPMSERFDHQPIKIALNQKDLKELYESAYSLTKSLDENRNGSFVNKCTPKDFEEAIISKLKKLLGPWIVCFSGKSKCSRDDSENIDRVDLFLTQSQHKFSKRQQMLVYLFARRISMLTKENIKDAALLISKTKYEYWDLMDFFGDFKLICKAKPDSYPVILVVDEHIDFMFWEMLNVDQEFTRVDSMVALLKLFFQHQDNISEGYFNVKGRKASAVLDPDRTLPSFVSSVRPFMEILPSTTCNFLISKEPQFSDLQSMLASSDVYVYCGHGSGLQFISSYETCQLSTNAVVFLMGCSSVAMQANYGYCLATAAHHYYHIAKSPAVLGHLTTTYVHYGSLLLNIILGKWFSHVTNYKDNLFGEEWMSWYLKDSLTGNGTGFIQYSPYLSNIIAQLRKKLNIEICARAILCHRGLPVRMAI